MLMQIKTINKIISKKMNEWLDTISDESLREKVKESLLVSGGCITSMLLKIPVNDYDVYIQDMNVLKELAEYYCPGSVFDGREKEKLLHNATMHSSYDEEDNLSQQVVRIKTLKPDQIKMDVPSQGQRMTITDKEKPYQVSFVSQNAISLTDNIQIVTRFSGTPSQIHSSFDFIHATNYFTFKDKLVFNEAALKSIITKTLSYQGSHYPVTSVIRMKKFINRQWTINAGEILKMLFQISRLDLTDIEVLEEQLIGVDVAYFSILIDRLRGASPEELTPEYLNHTIDEVFNLFDDSSEEETNNETQ
jgi:hypothetical protein